MNLEKKTQSESTRVTIRMTKEQYALLNEGAALSGNQSLNSFMVSSALAEARKLRIEDSFLNSMNERKIYDLKKLDEDVVVLNKTEAMSLYKALNESGLANTFLRDLILNKIHKDISYEKRKKYGRELLGL